MLFIDKKIGPVIKFRIEMLKIFYYFVVSTNGVAPIEPKIFLKLMITKDYAKIVASALCILEEPSVVLVCIWL